MANTRTFTRAQLDAIGVPYECEAFEGAATELHCEQVDTRRWVSVHELVFRAPDDGKAYRVTYEQGLTEHQDDHDHWGYQDTVKATEMEPYEEAVTRWRPVEPVPAVKRPAGLDALLGYVAANLPGEDDTPTGQKYPCGICVYCDRCGTENRGDYIVTDDMGKAARLEVAREHLRREGWSCTAAGDFCPTCAKQPTTEPDPAEAAQRPSLWPWADAIPEQPTPAEQQPAEDAEPFEYTDGDGDKLTVVTDPRCEQGPGLLFHTSDSGCSVPLSEVPGLIVWLGKQVPELAEAVKHLGPKEEGR